MTESGISPNSIELPCDTEPKHHCGCSQALCEVCTPRRSLIAAVRDLSAAKDLPVWVWDELLAPKRDNLISLADERRKRRAS